MTCVQHQHWHRGKAHMRPMLLSATQPAKLEFTKAKLTATDLRRCSCMIHARTACIHTASTPLCPIKLFAGKIPVSSLQWQQHTRLPFIAVVCNAAELDAVMISLVIQSSSYTVNSRVQPCSQAFVLQSRQSVTVFDGVVNASYCRFNSLLQRSSLSLRLHTAESTGFDNCLSVISASWCKVNSLLQPCHLLCTVQSQ